MSKKQILIASCIVLAVIAGGVYVYLSMRVKPSQLFRNYIEKSVVSTKQTVQESYSGTGATVTDEGTLDTSKKTFIQQAELSCNVNVDSKDISVKATIQQNGSAQYIRYDSATGEIKNNDSGQTIDVATAYAKAVGKWYEINAEDPVAKAQIDSGVYAFNSSLTAPSYDKARVTNALIDKGVFTYGAMNKDGANYTLAITSHRDAYLDMLKETFPNLSKPDLVIENVFGDKPTLESTVTLKKDGTLVSEKLSQINLCVSIIEGGFATTHDTMPSEITGTSTPVKFGSVKITPVAGAKPISDIRSDISY